MLEKKFTLLPLMALSLQFHSYAYADDGALIVRADRIKSSLDKSPSDIKVFEAEEIERATSINELFSAQSDLKLAQSGPPGANTSLFLRGSDSSHTLVIIDGIIMNDPSNTTRQFDLGRLSLNNIERIEILKGSQGLLYGSNAIGGVILITTKKVNEKDFGSATLDYGTFSTFNAAANFQKKFETNSFSIGVDQFKTKGFSAAQPGLEDDGEKRTTISTGLAQTLGTFGEFTLNYRGVYDESDLDKGGGPGSDDPNDYLKSQQHYMKAGHNYNWSKAETSVIYSKSLHYRELHILPDVINPAESLAKSKGELDALAINHTQYTTEKLTQNINVDYQHESDKDGHYNENTSLFLYNRYELESDIFNLGARIDNNKYFGEHLTYKAAYLHNFDVSLIKLSYSTGFRAPSLFQLYDVNSGNKNLEPEKSQTAELGFETYFAIHKNTSTFFYTEIDNRHSYEPVTFKTRNAGRARIMGFENIFATQLSPETSIDVAATWLSARDMTASQKLARRPNINTKVALNHKADHQFINFQADFTGKRPDVDNAGSSVSLPSYMIFHAEYSVDMNEQLQTYAKVRNILDKEYEDIAGFGTGGRIMTVGVKYFF